jgi:hypothetical protein
MHDPASDSSTWWHSKADDGSSTLGKRMEIVLKHLFDPNGDVELNTGAVEDWVDGDFLEKVFTEGQIGEILGSIRNRGRYGDDGKIELEDGDVIGVQVILKTKDHNQLHMYVMLQQQTTHP